MSEAAIERVATIVVRRNSTDFLDLLRSANNQFRDPSFEASLAAYLRAEPQVVEAWSVWSGDQRWTPSAYFNGTETGWYDSGYEHVRHHSDRADAAADFIHRLAAWLAERRVIGSDEASEGA